MRIARFFDRRALVEFRSVDVIVEEAIAALPRVIALDRKKVRQRFEQRFSATRMAKDYVSVYRSLTESSKSVDVAKQAPRLRVGSGQDLGNGKDAIILRPSIA